MNIDEESRVARKLALPVILAVIGVLLLLRFTKINNGDSVSMVLAAIVDNSVAALIAAASVTAFVFYLGHRVGRTDTYFLRGKRLKDLLTADAESSQTWRIRARTGSYFTRETLPKLNQNAVVNMILMDPSRTADLTNYQALRPTNEQDNWDPLRIQADIIVSIIRAVQTKTVKPFMTINLHTSATTWTQSLDISDKHSFLCGQGKKDLALVSPVSDEIYERFLDDFTVLRSLADSRTIPTLTNPGRPNEPITDAVVDAFDSTLQSWFGLDVNSNGLKGKIVERAARGHHYG